MAKIGGFWRNLAGGGRPPLRRSAGRSRAKMICPPMSISPPWRRRRGMAARRCLVRAAQGEFLADLGITARAEQLMKANPGSGADPVRGRGTADRPRPDGHSVQGAGLPAALRRQAAGILTMDHAGSSRRQSRRPARHRAWLFRTRRRRVGRHLCQPELRPGQQGRSRLGGRESRPRGGGAGAGRQAGHPGPDPQPHCPCRGRGLGRRPPSRRRRHGHRHARPGAGHPDRRLRPGAVRRRARRG